MNHNLDLPEAGRELSSAFSFSKSCAADADFSPEDFINHSES